MNERKIGQPDDVIDVGTVVGLIEHALKTAYPQGATLPKGIEIVPDEVVPAIRAALVELDLKAQEPQVRASLLKKYARQPLQRCIEFVPFQDGDGTDSGPVMTLAPWEAVRVIVHADTSPQFATHFLDLVIKSIEVNEALGGDLDWQRIYSRKMAGLDDNIPF